VDRAYHKILGAVKGKWVLRRSWGRSTATGVRPGQGSSPLSAGSRHARLISSFFCHQKCRYCPDFTPFFRSITRNHEHFSWPDPFGLRPENMSRDEKAKGRPRHFKCSLFIIGSGHGDSRVPQNLGMGQKEYPDRNILGLGRGLRNRRRGAPYVKCPTSSVGVYLLTILRSGWAARALQASDSDRSLGNCGDNWADRLLPSSPDHLVRPDEEGLGDRNA